MNQPLAEMFRYNRWANRMLLEACRDLNDSQLDSRLEAASGSVRELLMHIVGGEQTFLLRTKGRQHEGELTRESMWPGFDTLLDLERRTDDELISIAEGLESEGEVDLPWQGKSYRYPFSFFLVHAMEHSAEHRTEVKLSLKSIGFETPDLDAWPYSVAAGYGKEVS